MPRRARRNPSRSCDPGRGRLVILVAAALALNHEETLVVYDAGIARRLHDIFREDLAHAREVTLDDWKRRGVGHFLEMFVLPIRNQL